MDRPRRQQNDFATIADRLARDGFCVTPDAFEPQLVRSLAAEARELWEDDEYHAARVGTGEDRQLALSVRSDRIVWLSDAAMSPAQLELTEQLEALRVAINQASFLGLFEWEGHYACYPPGGRYRRHLDVFAHSRERRVSTILYLNEDWAPGDGGELRLWTEPAGPQWTPDSPTIEIAPRAGTLVTFLAEDYYHEVLCAHRDRFSLTGWFRTRSATIG